MASIADVFFKALLDTAQLQVDAVKAGNKAGETMGQKMSAGLKSGLKTAAFAGLTAGLAIATKGVIELENVTADFTAQTGVAGEEAKAAGKAINEMAGSNLQPMAEIGEALTKVHTDLGLTGDAAVATTKDFLKFGRATKQNAAAAVLKFDDILDAWNLTAEDSQGLMDKLIVSHQKYGGSVEESEQALADLAPSLQAANLTIDDGIGLLNLFAASGVDSAVAVTGMQKALTKVKSPKELKRLIEDIKNTADPFLRAQKAADLFGAKAGAKLANVLKPGIEGLDDFAISTEEAAGATEDAAAAIDGTFGNRVQLLLKGFTSKLTELGSSFGPVLTGLAALTSLAGSLGLDRALSGAFAKLGVSGAIRGAATRAGTIIGGIFGAVMGGAIHIAEALVHKFSEVAQHVAVRLAASRAGAIIGGIFGAALGAFTKLAEALSAAFLKLPGAPRLVAAVRGAGMKLGVAFQAAFLLGLAALALEVSNFISDKLAPDPKDVAARVEQVLTEGTAEGIKRTIAALQTQRDLAQSWLTELLFGPTENQKAIDAGIAQLQAQLDAGLSAITFKKLPLTDAIIAEMEAGELAVRPAAEAVGGAIKDGIGDGADEAADEVETATQRILTALGALRSEIGAAAAAAAGAIWDPILKEAELAQTKFDIAEQGRIIKDKDSTKKQVREAMERRTELQKQLFLQISDLTTYGTDAERIAAVKAALTSDAVAQAYKDGTPEQRAAIDEWRRVMGVQLTKLETSAATGGEATVDAYAGGLKDGKTAITTAAGTAVSGVDTAMKLQRAHQWGDNVGDAWVRGVVSGIRSGRSAIYGAVLFASAGLHGKSPPKVGPLREIDVWGANVMQAWVDGLLSKTRDVRRAAMTISAAAAPSIAMPTLGAAVSIPGSAAPALSGTGIAQASVSGGDIYNINTHVDGLIKTRDPLEVSGQLRRLAEQGVLSPKKTSYA